MAKKKTVESITLEEIEQFVMDAGSDDLPTFGGKYQGGIHCQQVPDEIAQCILAIMEAVQPIKNYLEIGVAAGGATFLMNHFLKPENIVLIDDNKHHKSRLRADILKGIAYQEIVGRSDDEAVIQAVANLGILFGLILIDGDHNYPSVKLDTITYLPYLAPGGFLILHDSALNQWGVPRVVKELKADPGMEFIGEYISSVHTPCGVALFRKVDA